MFLKEILTCPDCAAHSQDDSVRHAGQGRRGSSGH
jgi:hypothetical protein